MIEGRILSVESMGLLDGPGIRTVVFMKGCSLRCLYCHNPDSWSKDGGDTVSSEELVRRICRFRPYFERSGGGVTFSGGEPLLQEEFLIDCLYRLKKEGIHTCLDTAGCGNGSYNEILSLTDLVLYDVKATDAEGYRLITNADIERAHAFERAMIKNQSAVIVRQVVIPGINDTDAYMTSLSDYIRERIPGAQGVELLPYHRMGSHKYKKLEIPEPLGETPAMDKERTLFLQQKYFDKWNERK